MRDDTNFLSLFDKQTQTRALKPGELLFNEGDPADSLFVVKSGELQVFVGDHVLETVHEGGIIGEMAIVDHEPRSASVKALVASEVIAVDQRRFLWMIEQTPYFAIRVMKILIARLRKTDAMVKALK